MYFQRPFFTLFAAFALGFVVSHFDMVQLRKPTIPAPVQVQR